MEYEAVLSWCTVIPTLPNGLEALSNEFKAFREEQYAALL
jgi:hypothetical protein